jgi:hypothetical protein
VHHRATNLAMRSEGDAERRLAGEERAGTAVTTM